MPPHKQVLYKSGELILYDYWWSPRISVDFWWLLQMIRSLAGTTTSKSLQLLQTRPHGPKIYTKYHGTTETEQKISTCSNLLHSQLLDESGKPLVLRLLWQCIENWIADDCCDIGRRGYDLDHEVSPRVWSLILAIFSMWSLQHWIHTCVSWPYYWQSKDSIGNIWRPVYNGVSNSGSHCKLLRERERDTKATCGSSSNTCGTLWNMTCGLYLWGRGVFISWTTGQHHGEVPGICHAPRSDRPPQSCWLETCFSTSEGVTLLRFLKDELMIYY